ncbi:hypothetical protein D3C78_1542200 [compost metagenome]
MRVNRRLMPPVLSPASLGAAAAAMTLRLNQRLKAVAQRYLSGRSTSQNRMMRLWSVWLAA